MKTGMAAGGGEIGGGALAAGREAASRAIGKSLLYHEM